MSSATWPRVGRPPGPAGLRLPATPTHDPSDAATDAANSRTGNWQDPAVVAEPRFFHVSGQANESSAVDKEWMALARAAQTRWLRENPF